jgi:PASTA domain
MNRSPRVRAARLLAIVGLALAASGWAAAPSDAAVTLGSNLATEPSNTVFCANGGTTRGCLAVQDVFPGRDLSAPFSGVIVRWHVRLGSETEAQTIRIRVVRRVAPEEFKIISSSPFESIPAGEGTYTFPAAVPIASGDQVGLEGDSGKGLAAEGTLAGAESFLFNVAPETDGAETGLPVFPIFENREVLMNVEVEPDCDHDGLGDETQDSDTSSCHPPPSVSTGLPEAPKTCLVPKLKGKKLKAAKKRARKAHCKIGHVKRLKGVTAKTGKVVKQKPKAGKVKAAGSKIAVTLG